MRTDDFQRKAYYHQFMHYSLIKPLLFSLSPEEAHDLTLKLAKLSPAMGKLTGVAFNPRLSIKTGNTNWKSPIGLAAGLDKNAEALKFFSHQGFGAIECGTITLKAQVGNPKPRLWRYPEDRSLRNAMGFPNHGLLEILPRLRAYEENIPVGANIGKNKDSTPEESIEELSILTETLNESVDYFVVNVSSPNTPGLRALQERSYLAELFTELNKSLNGRDLYLKIAPDLSEEKVRELATLASEFKLTGLIATNTTIMPEKGIGGVSGELLKQRSRLIRETILKENLPIELIGVGGVSCFEDVLQFWRAGGKSMQVYTGYVYQGSSLLKKIQKEMIRFLDKESIYSLQEFFDLSKEERIELLNSHYGSV